MMKANKKTLIITSIVTVLPILIGIIFWKRLPDTMATHFGADNEANGFSSKIFAVFGIPLFCLAMLWLDTFITSHDPRKQNISPKVFAMLLWIVPICSLIAAAVTYPYNLGYKVNITFFMELLMGVLFIVLGNYLPKSRQNYTVGIKIPWTMANEDNWNRTHRFAGYLWIVGGIIMIIIGLTQIVSAEWLFGIIFVMVLIPSVYSFWLHAKKNL